MDEADLLALVAMCPTADDVRQQLSSTVMAEAHARWDAYCQRVERLVLTEGGGGGRDDGDEDRGGVFGCCRRCGGRRLLVTNKQLRRADEGMTAPTAVV